MDRLIKSLPERKRRTFLRYMKKGKETEEATDGDADADANEKDGKPWNADQRFENPRAIANQNFLFSTEKTDASDATATTKKTKRVTFMPHNREELLNKIESLKLADDEDEDDDDFSFCDSDFDSDFDGEDVGDDDD